MDLGAGKFGLKAHKLKFQDVINNGNYEIVVSLSDKPNPTRSYNETFELKIDFKPSESEKVKQTYNPWQKEKEVDKKPEVEIFTLNEYTVILPDIEFSDQDWVFNHKP